MDWLRGQNYVSSVMGAAIGVALSVSPMWKINGVGSNLFSSQMGIAVLITVFLAALAVMIHVVSECVVLRQENVFWRCLFVSLVFIGIFGGVYYFSLRNEFSDINIHELDVNIFLIVSVMFIWTVVNCILSYLGRGR